MLLKFAIAMVVGLAPIGEVSQGNRPTAASPARSADEPSHHEMIATLKGPSFFISVDNYLEASWTVTDSEKVENYTIRYKPPQRKRQVTVCVLRPAEDIPCVMMKKGDNLRLIVKYDGKSYPADIRY